ncbi:hypothetical protein GCM10017744_056100 [Streptomyces antimycoticus]|uniref:Uncharacterized protein n=1 Tax=Streptomyces antimycoticus TaxID=68175 RepID=A0A499ULQ3_9ACTN|nr:hypothetical protein SSPO_054620 [Streptomyces antimycoticus]
MGDEDVVEDAADREAYRGDRWMGTHVRFPSVIRGGASGGARSYAAFRHAAYVDGDRSELFPEHRTPTRRQRSLGRVIKGGVRPFPRVPGVCRF